MLYLFCLQAVTTTGVPPSDLVFFLVLHADFSLHSSSGVVGVQLWVLMVFAIGAPQVLGFSSHFLDHFNATGTYGILAHHKYPLPLLQQGVCGG